MASKSLTLEFFGRDVSASAALLGISTAGTFLGTSLSKVAFSIGRDLAEAGRAAVDFSIDSIKAFAEAETAQTRLAFAFEKYPNLIGGNVAALQTMNTALQKTTRFEDDAIAAAEGTLAMYDLNADQLATLTPLMLDYAAATGKDAGEAAEDLGKAILGQGRALKAVGLNFEDAGDPLSNYTQLVTGLRTQVQGFAEKDANTLSGRMDQIKNQFDAVQEKLGEAFAPGLEVAADVIDGTLIPALDRIITKVGPELQDKFDEIAPKLEDAVDDAMPSIERLLEATPDALVAVAEGISDAIQLIDDFSKISAGDLSPIARDNPWMEGPKPRESATEENQPDWLFSAHPGDSIFEPYQTQLEAIAEFNEKKTDEIKTHWATTLEDMRAASAALSLTSEGYNFAAGFADGITTGSELAVLAAERMALAARDKVKGAMLIQSPSKVMRDLGAYIPQGLALGIEDDMWRVNAAFDGMAPTSVGAVSMASRVGAGGGGPNVTIQLSGIYAGDQNALARTVRDVLRDGVKNGSISAGSALA